MVNYTFSSYCSYTALQTSHGIANKQWRSHPNSRQTLTAHHAHSYMVWVASDRHGYACVCLCVCVCVCVRARLCVFDGCVLDVLAQREHQRAGMHCMLPRGDENEKT